MALKTAGVIMFCSDLNFRNATSQDMIIDRICQ